MVDLDVTPGHLSWIVDGRSTNQQYTMELNETIYNHEVELNSSPAHHEASQELTGVAFSLWRAVFLSATTGEFDDRLAEVRKFLVGLISDNAVLYVTDKHSRNWSFRYYLDNGIYRLKKLCDEPLNLVDHDAFFKPVAGEKEEWLNAQKVFSQAVTRFEASFQTS